MLRRTLSPIVLCSAALFVGCGGATSPADATREATAAAETASQEDEAPTDPRGYVHVVDDQHVRLDTGVDALFCDGCPADPASARLVPRMERGALVGFRWTSLGADSVWWALGMRNGDVLVAVDGVPASALTPTQVYEHLLDTGDVTFTFIRRDEPGNLRVVTFESE